MKNPFVASIVAASMTVCLLLVTGLNFAMMLLARAELSRPDAPPLVTDGGELMSHADIEALVVPSGTALVCVVAALVAVVVVALVAVPRVRRVPLAAAAVPALFVVASFVVPVAAGRSTGAMTVVFTLLAVAATLAQAGAVARRDSAIVHP